MLDAFKKSLECLILDGSAYRSTAMEQEKTQFLQQHFPDCASSYRCFGRN